MTFLNTQQRGAGFDEKKIMEMFDTCFVSDFQYATTAIERQQFKQKGKRSSLSFVTQSQHHCCELIFAQLIKGATRSKRVLWHEFVYFAVFTWVPHWPKLSNLTLGTVSIRAGTRTQPPPTSNINQQKYSKVSSKMKQDWCLETIVWSSLSKTKSRPKTCLFGALMASYR